MVRCSRGWRERDFKFTGPEEHGAGTAEIWRCYFWTSLLHAINIQQSVDPLVPGQQSKASRGCPSLWKVGSAAERGGDRIM